MLYDLRPVDRIGTARGACSMTAPGIRTDVRLTGIIVILTS